MAQTRCTHCDRKLDYDARFCTQCGNPLIDSAPSLRRADTAASDSQRFGRFLAFAGRFPFWLGLTPHRALIEALRAADLSALFLTAAGSFVLIVGSGLVMGLGKKLSAVRAEPLLASHERIVLYLRSFAHDEAGPTLSKLLLANVTGSPLRFFITAEERLAELLSRVGPFVALGRRGEALPTLGAARLYVADDEWRHRVTELMTRADLLVFRAGTTSALWERSGDGRSHFKARAYSLLVSESQRRRIWRFLQESTRLLARTAAGGQRQAVVSLLYSQMEADVGRRSYLCFRRCIRLDLRSWTSIRN